MKKSRAESKDTLIHLAKIRKISMSCNAASTDFVRTQNRLLGLHPKTPTMKGDTHEAKKEKNA